MSACSISTYTKIRMIKTRIVCPLRKDDADFIKHSTFKTLIMKKIQRLGHFSFIAFPLVLSVKSTLYLSTNISKYVTSQSQS